MIRAPRMRFKLLALLVLLGAAGLVGCGGGSGSSGGFSKAWMVPIQNVPGVSLGPAKWSETFYPLFHAGPGDYQIGSWQETVTEGGQGYTNVNVTIGIRGYWSSPEVVTRTPYPYDLDIGPNGDAVLGCYDNFSNGTGFTLRRRVGGTWDATGMPMDTPGYASFYPDPVPSVRMDAQGRAVAVWRSYSTPSKVLATRWENGAWSPVVTLATEEPGVSLIQDSGLSVSPSGDAVIWWRVAKDGDESIFTTRWNAGQAPAGPYQLGNPGLNAPGSVRFPVQGIKVLWTKDGAPLIGRYDPTGAFEVSSWNGGGWSQPVSLPPQPGQGLDNAIQLDLHTFALDPSGAPIVLWMDFAEDGSIRVMCSKYTASGFQAPTLLATSPLQYGSYIGYPPQVLSAGNPDGTLALMWECGVPDTMQEPITPYRVGEVSWSAQGIGPVNTPIGSSQTLHLLGLINLGGGKAQVIWCVLGQGGSTWNITASSID